MVKSVILDNMEDKNLKHRITSLEEHLRRDPVDVDSASISDHSFYSYRHANRLFSSVKGESINAFVNKLRLQKAAESLKYSSQPLFDIAIEVGYESSASFSKAFKKLYGDSPKGYRQKHKKQFDTLEDRHEIENYSIQRLDHLTLRSKKIAYNINASEEEFESALTNELLNSSLVTNKFLLLWDEDPEICPFDESRFFLTTEEQGAHDFTDAPPTIAGKYAMFQTEIFETIDYSDWHRLAFLVLELDKIEVRDGTYIEYYAVDNFKGSEFAMPYQIAVPIE